MPRLSKRAERAALWGGLLSVQQLVSRELNTALEREAGIPVAWYEVLLLLYRCPGHRLRLQDLEKGTLHSQSGLTRLVDRMQQAGHVAREQAEEDRRGVYARLTTEGMRVFRRAAPTYVNGIHQHFLSHMSEQEANAVADVLERVREALRREDDC